MLEPLEDIIEEGIESLNIGETIKEPKEVIPIDQKQVFELDKAANAPQEKINAVGLSYYGEFFRKYHRIGEIKELIPEFKEFYYEEKIKDPKKGLLHILQEFNKEHAYPHGKQFHPYPTQVKLWTTKWNKDINEKRLEQGLEVIPKPNVKQIMKTRGEDGEITLGSTSDGDLEMGMKSLAGELINDALQVMKDTQELEEVYTAEELIKKKNYVLNVMAHTTRLVHGKAALMLKASEEKRNNTTFLMDILAKAASGQMSQEEMDVLKIPYQKHGQPVAAS